MPRFLGIGNGKDGVIDLGSYTPVNVTCSGTSGSTSLTATATFSAGDRIFIHQTRGTGAGVYEDNAVASYVSGTITLVHPLENTYTDSGASQAQVYKVLEASSVTGSYTLSTWDGDKGGIFVMSCAGVFSGIVTATGKGFLGGLGYNLGNYAGYGEGTVGARLASVPGSSNAANGNGGGATSYGSGASGGHANAGTNGNIASGGPAGLGGSAVGDATFSSLINLGGGAAGSHGAESLTGGNGGGIIIIYANSISNTASLVANGANGSNHTIAIGSGASGGAGGSILIKSKSIVLGTVTATGGTGGTGSGGGVSGVSGSVGRIRIESCSLSGTTTPTASTSTGGHSYCGSATFIM